MEDSSVTVLVVDDLRLAAEITGMTLEPSGFQLMEEDGLSALARVAGDASLRAVVSDLNQRVHSQGRGHGEPAGPGGTPCRASVTFPLRDHGTQASQSIPVRPGPTP